MSFVQGLSGLNAASKDLEVIGNNVANVNTVGFKASQAQFADVFAASLGGAGSSQIGIGSKLATVAQQFTQGSISTTNNPLDMAVNGPGFFVVHGVNGTGYTRNGQFQVDKAGNIVTSTGLNLQGWPAVGGAVASSGPTQNLVISTANIAPVATSSMIVGMNLDSRLQPPTVRPFSPTNTSSYTNSTSTTVYDTLGNALINTMYFVKAPTVPASADVTTAVIPAGGSTVSVGSVAGLVQGQAISVGGTATTISTINTAANTFTTTIPIAAGAASGAAITYYNTTGTVSSSAPVPTTGNVQTVAVANVLGLAVGQPVTMTVGGTTYTTDITSINTATNTFTIAQNNLNVGAATAMSFGAMTGNAWNIYSTTSDPNVPVTTPPTYLYPNPSPAAGAWRATGTLTFSTTGVIATTVPTWYTTTNPTSLTLPSVDAAHPVVTYDFSGATQFGAGFGITQITTDGNTSGSLVGYSAAANGTISGTYSNGKTQVLGQVALATFANNQGLQPLGSNEWAATNASGAALTGVPGSGLNGVLQTSSVEGSSTDLTAELVNMITAQRDYQANSQTIKTQETIMQTLINMR